MQAWRDEWFTAPLRSATALLWRGVEAQHRVATMRLVDSLDDQAMLERLLEASKPALPPAADGLHYLLATPFRYRSPHGSRFRAGTDPASGTARRSARPPAPRSATGAGAS